MPTAVLKCPLPPTLNEQIRDARSNKFVSAKTKREWTERIARYARDQKVPAFTGRVWLIFDWRVKSFARDPDNVAAAAKYVMDGLVLAGVLPNDNLSSIAPAVFHGYDRSRTDGLILTLSDRPDLSRIIALIDRAKASIDSPKKSSR